MLKCQECFSILIEISWTILMVSWVEHKKKKCFIVLGPYNSGKAYYPVLLGTAKMSSVHSVNNRSRATIRQALIEESSRIEDLFLHKNLRHTYTEQSSNFIRLFFLFVHVFYTFRSFIKSYDEFQCNVMHKRRINTLHPYVTKRNYYDTIKLFHSQWRSGVPENW